MIQNTAGTPPRSNAPKGERELVATRIPPRDKSRLIERARSTGLSVSEYLDHLITKDLNDRSGGRSSPE